MFGNVHPKDIDGRAQLLNLNTGAGVGDSMAPIRSNDQISAKIAFAIRSLGPHAHDSVAFDNQIDNFVLHAERERRECFGFAGQKVQKILRNPVNVGRIAGDGYYRILASSMRMPGATP